MKTQTKFGSLAPLNMSEWVLLKETLCECDKYRVKSDIFGQTAKFGQRPGLFHISNSEIKKIY